MSQPLVRPAFLFIILALITGMNCPQTSVCAEESAARSAQQAEMKSTDSKRTDMKGTDSKRTKSKKSRASRRGSAIKDTDPRNAKAITDEIKSRIKLYEKAFDEGDAKTIASMWVENGTYTGPDGIEYVGRENVEQAFARFFKALGTPPISIEVKSIRPIGDSAIEERGIASIRGQDGKLLPGTRYITIHVKEDGEWRIASVTERGPVLPRVPLSSLSWLVGEWKANGSSGQSAFSTKWEGDQHFLVSKFNSKSAGGKENNDVQVIGVDPTTGQIVSWIFDSEGGTGTGRWLRRGDHWMAELKKVEADGTRFTATDIIAPSGPNSFTWQSINRTIDGLPTASTEKVSVERIR